MEAKTVVNSNNISGLIERTLNYVDPRLVDHGKRVASLVYGMLEAQKSILQRTCRISVSLPCCMISVLIRQRRSTG